jgi:hypothetical protein
LLNPDCYSTLAAAIAQFQQDFSEKLAAGVLSFCLFPSYPFDSFFDFWLRLAALRLALRFPAIRVNSRHSRIVTLKSDEGGSSSSSASASASPSAFAAIWNFEFRASDLFRVSDFEFRVSDYASRTRADGSASESPVFVTPRNGFVTSL